MGAQIGADGMSDYGLWPGSIYGVTGGVMGIYFLVLPLLSILVLYGAYQLNRWVSRHDHPVAWRDAVGWGCAYFVSGALSFVVSIAGL